jgi:SOS-response transcriptional repressor LexA
MHGFTPRQLEIKSFIELRTQADGRSPTYREIQAHFGFRCISSVESHLLLIEKKCAIRRERYEHRGIRILGAALAPAAA